MRYIEVCEGCSNFKVTTPLPNRQPSTRIITLFTMCWKCVFK